MSSSSKNLSVFGASPLRAEGMRIGIIVAEWNNEITYALRDGAVATLKKYGVAADDIFIHEVPGSFELPGAAQMLLLSDADVQAVICIGCVVQGETPHFDYICQAVSQGIMTVGIECNAPVIFGVLTVNNQQEAIDRAGGKHGNKGDEAAYTALRMAVLQEQLKGED